MIKTDFLGGFLSGLLTFALHLCFVCYRLDSVAAFRVDVLRQASLKALNLFQTDEQTKTAARLAAAKKVKGQETFPEHYHVSSSSSSRSSNKDRFRERRKISGGGSLARYKSLPELSQIPEADVLSPSAFASEHLSVVG